MFRLISEIFAVWRWQLTRLMLKHYAGEYRHIIKREGFAWTMVLIDEDEDLLGYAYNHTLVRAGCIAYAEDQGIVRRPYDGRRG